MDLKVRFRVTFHRLFGLPTGSGPYVLRYRRGRKRGGEAAPQKSDAKGQVLLDHTFEVDGTLQCCGGNQYRPKWLQFAVEEVRNGRRYSFGNARLDLTECIPFGHPNVRQLAFGLCSGDLLVRGTLASGAMQPLDDMPLACTLFKQLHDAQHRLREQGAALAALQGSGPPSLEDLGTREDTNSKPAPGRAVQQNGRQVELPRRIEQLEGALQVRTQECSNLRACVLMLEEKVSGGTTEPPPRPAELVGGARRCSELEQALGAAHHKCSGLADVLEVQHVTIATLERQLASAAHALQAAVRRREVDATEVVLCRRRLEAELREAEGAQAAAQALVRETTEALSVQQCRCASLEAEVETLHGLLEDAGQATQAVRDLQAQLWDKTTVCCRLMAEVAALHAAAETAQANHLKALQTTQTETEALQAQVTALQQEKDALQLQCFTRESENPHRPCPHHPLDNLGFGPNSPDPQSERGGTALATLWTQLQAKDEEIQRLQQENARLAANFSPDRRPSSRTPAFRLESAFRPDSNPSSPMFLRRPEPAT